MSSITFWDKRELIVSNKDVRLDGLAMPAAKTMTLAYALTIEDAVIFVDPNTNLAERLIAGMFMLPTPVKFGKPFLKHADDLGGSGKVGRKGKTDGNLLDAKGTTEVNNSIKSGEKARQHVKSKIKIAWLEKASLILL